jgi:pilus assembly protein CpaB
MSSSQPQSAARGYSTITLALTPKEVEMIIFASQKGRLSLSLRNDEETKFDSDLQSVNFKFLEKNIPVYNSERQNRQKLR